MEIKDATVFYVVAGLIIGYIVYMMVRKRKGERAGSSAETSAREPEL